MLKTARITSGGQISLPASVRKRWQTRSVIVEDEGDRVILRPLPDDPIAAVRGMIETDIDVEELRARARADDEAAQRRR